MLNTAVLVAHRATRRRAPPLAGQEEARCMAPLAVVAAAAATQPATQRRLAETAARSIRTQQAQVWQAGRLPAAQATPAHRARRAAAAGQAAALRLAQAQGESGVLAACLVVAAVAAGQAATR